MFFNDEEQLHGATSEEAQTTSENAPEVETPVVSTESATPSEPAAVTMAEAMEQDAYAQNFKKLSRGDLVEGTVVHVEKDSVLVDVGTKSEGVIPLDELSNEMIQSTDGVVTVGEKINVVVLQAENEEGNPILSKRRADFEDAWDRIETVLREQTTIAAMVTERVKGGLVVDVGVRGFVPATHVGNGRLRNIERYVGQSLPLKVLEIDRDRRKVVLSNKLAEDELRESSKVEVFARLQPGQILEGTVRRITDYGAFVDLGGVDGLLHVSEMSWARIAHPSEVMKEGDKVKVIVLRTDADAGKVSLGHRQVLPDPWTLVADAYTVGATVSLPISRLVQSGAFVRLPEGVEAFIPISEMAQRRINKPGDVVSKGQVVEAQIMDVRPDERRMVLSLKALQQHVERQEVEKHMPRQQQGGTTIGDRLGALRGLLEESKPEASAEPVEVTVEVSAEVPVEAPVEKPAKVSKAAAKAAAEAIVEVPADVPVVPEAAEPIAENEPVVTLVEDNAETAE
jgi:ribosomal protein S1